MSKSVPPRIRMFLRVLASKLERDLLDESEIAAIANLLRRLGDGEAVDDIFGIWRPANRPQDPTREQRLYEMAVMRLPVELGGEGKSYRETVAETAQRYGKSFETIKKEYASERGREVQADVKANGELAPSLGCAEKWQGGKTQE